MSCYTTPANSHFESLEKTLWDLDDMHLRGKKQLYSADGGAQLHRRALRLFYGDALQLDQLLRTGGD